MDAWAPAPSRGTALSARPHQDPSWSWLLWPGLTLEQLHIQLCAQGWGSEHLLIRRCRIWAQTGMGFLLSSSSRLLTAQGSCYQHSCSETCPKLGCAPSWEVSPLQEHVSSRQKQEQEVLEGLQLNLGSS